MGQIKEAYEFLKFLSDKDFPMGNGWTISWSWNTYKHGDGRSATRLYNKNADLFLKGYFCDERRNEKWRLQPGKGRLKICSYHSYKGWESSHIILLFEGIGDDLKWKEEQKMLCS